MALPENAVLEGDASRSAGRRPVIDVLRGVAVAAMVVYHTAWDLSELNLVAFDVTGSPGWSLFARTIAASFLTLAGIGLALAHGQGVRRRAFVRRLALLGTAALAVTAVTRIVFPESYIFFGILHNLALSSLIALPFVRWPVAITAAAAALAWVLPLAAAGPAFDAPLISFLGLGTTFPVTNDYVPVFPWTGFVLAGIAAARLGADRLPGGTGGRAAKVFAAVGRRSLVIYLLHQPLIFGALTGVREVTGPNPVAEAAPFMRSCEAGCRGASGSEAVCRSSCACTVDALKREGLWQAILGGRPGAPEMSRASGLAQSCLDAAR